MERQHKLAEVYRPTVVCVKSSEHILAEPGRVAAGKHLAVHLDKLFLGQLSRGTVLQEAFMPSLDCENLKLNWQKPLLK